MAKEKQIDQLTVATSAALSDVLALVQSLETKQISVEDLRDSMGVLTSTSFPSDTAWTTTTSLSNGWTGTIHYIRRAGMVTVSIDANGSSKTDNTMLTLVSAYRPGVQCELDVNGSVLQIQTSGNIESNSSTSSVKGTFTYPVI
jgi:hypothetical protein